MTEGDRMRRIFAAAGEMHSILQQMLDTEPHGGLCPFCPVYWDDDRHGAMCPMGDARRLLARIDEEEGR